MTNVDKNRLFREVCKARKITDPDLKEKFHRYLGKYHRKVSNSYNFKRLLKTLDEFLETL